MTGRTLSISLPAAVGTLAVAAPAPAATSCHTRFSGRIGGKALEPGSYRALLTAVDAAGRTSKQAQVSFEVLKPGPTRRR
jgi:hypothetical protein